MNTCCKTSTQLNSWNEQKNETQDLRLMLLQFHGRKETDRLYPWVPNQKGSKHSFEYKPPRLGQKSNRKNKTAPKFQVPYEFQLKEEKLFQHYKHSHTRTLNSEWKERGKAMHIRGIPSTNKQNSKEKSSHSRNFSNPKDRMDKIAAGKQEL